MICRTNKLIIEEISFTMAVTEFSYFQLRNCVLRPYIKYEGGISSDILVLQARTPILHYHVGRSCISLIRLEFSKDQ